MRELKSEKEVIHVIDLELSSWDCNAYHITIVMLGNHNHTLTFS